MTQKSFKYGIIVANCVLTELSKLKSQSQRTALLGTIVTIDDILGNKTFALRILKDDNETWESSSFCSEQKYVVSVDEKLWPFLAAVSSPIERVELAKNQARCQQLLQISKESYVGFADNDDVYLGQVKFIGKVKGMGICFGIQLSEKRPKNRCDGSCAGIQYFSCLPGYGLFTTLERLVPYNIINPGSNTNQILPTVNLDFCLEKNVKRISINGNCDSDKKESKNEVGKGYTRENNFSSGKLNYFRTSSSLQNILDPGSNLSTNTNNDFDQNTILQPDNTYLINEKTNVQNRNSLVNKNKLDIDLIDAIGGTWSGTTDRKHLEAFSRTLKKSFAKPDKNGITNLSDKTVQAGLINIDIKTSRNKSPSIISHMVNGSKTLPKKSKLLQENVANKTRNTFVLPGEDRRHDITVR